MEFAFFFVRFVNFVSVLIVKPFKSYLMFKNDNVIINKLYKFVSENLLMENCLLIIENMVCHWCKDISTNHYGMVLHF